MAQIRELKKRMVAVRTIQRITKTMQMIATAKFTAALARAKATRPYTDRIRGLVGEVAAAAGDDFSHPLMKAPAAPVGRELVLVITSDRGLCGAYNGNVLRKGSQTIKGLKAAGKDIANPLGTILSASMLFDYAFGLTAEAKLISDVVNQSLAEGIVTEDIAEGGKAYKTSELGDWLAARILS